MTIAYGTILDENYLVQCLALYHSWLESGSTGRFYFFAMDQRASDVLRRLALGKARIVDRETFAHPDLEAQRPFRGNGELCWASKPLAIQFMLDEMPNPDWACYLDGDMAFFGDPEPVLAGAGTRAFGLLTPHRFGPRMLHWIPKVGIHNAGFAAFRDAPDTRRVLQRWFRDCLARPKLSERKGDTFDQKILDQISEEESHVADLDHPGINLAPWNADNCSLTGSGGKIRVNDRELILYHFQSLRMHTNRLFTLYNGDWRIPLRLRRFVYAPYVHRLRTAINDLQTVAPDYQPPVCPIAEGWKEALILASLLIRRNRHMMLA